MEEDEWDEHPLRHADQIIHCLQKVNLKYKQSSNGTVTSAAPSCSAAQLTAVRGTGGHNTAAAAEYTDNTRLTIKTIIYRVQLYLHKM